MDRIPFTYLVTHKASGKRYYGARYRKGCKPSDIGKIYFTSNKEIKSLVLSEGAESFTWEPRIICKSSKDAVKFEAKVLKRIKAASREDWFNLTNGDGNFLCTHHSEETLVKMRTVLKGTKHVLSAEACKARSIIAKNRPKKPCQYCGTLAASPMFTRWHGEKCKYKYDNRQKLF